MVTLVPTMILGPFAAGVGLLCLRPGRLRKAFVITVTLAVAAAALFLAWASLSRTFADLTWRPPLVDLAMTVGDVAIALYVIRVGWRERQPLLIALMLAQAALLLGFEARHEWRLEAVQNLYVDKFSVLMALINGGVGGVICLYALGYMKEYHEVAHVEVADRRHLFFAVLFVFLGAMFGIVFANNLLWLYFFWEVTTLCSYLLIGYTRTPEARRNALRALTMNAAGGLAFAGAIVWAHARTGSVELQTLLASKHALALFPAALLCLAGLTKSAQLPFASWLLGAMVAPTPVSALLHSSTMVKAGVYLVLRMAPVVTGTWVGLAIALVGSITFLVGSFAAVTTSDAKRVLAWSTVANLGLIVLCGGIGTSEAVWAGMLLIIFHAVAKCLLFLCVGVVEQRLHSRDLEAMSGLILNQPRVAVMMLIGMAGMFLAPFGMLISKWAVLKAVVDACPALTVFIVFGSSATLFFWVKWMGKLLEVVRPQEPVTRALGWGESVALHTLSAATFLTCLFFPFLSTHFIEPYVLAHYGTSVSMSPGNVTLMTIMMAMVTLFPLSFLHTGPRAKVMSAYLGGANLEHSSVRYRGGSGTPRDLTLENYYLRTLIPEASLVRWGTVACAALLGVILLLAAL